MLAGWPRPRLESAKGLRADRLESLPFAAVALDACCSAAAPRRVVFSANGLREGCLYEALTPLEQQIDPLLSLCESTARRMGRGGSGGDFLAGWIAPALEGLVPDKLRQAACHLSDIGWSEHPDYRAEQVFLRILRMPLTGADHRERIMLGLAVASRHAALRGTLKRVGLSSLISKNARRQAPPSVWRCALPTRSPAAPSAFLSSSDWSARRRNCCSPDPKTHTSWPAIRCSAGCAHSPPISAWTTHCASTPDPVAYPTPARCDCFSLSGRPLSPQTHIISLLL